MTDIEYIPTAPVIVEFRTIALVVIEPDPASCIAGSIRVTGVTRGSAKFNCISTTNTRDSTNGSNPVIGREEGILQSDTSFII